MGYPRRLIYLARRCRLEIEVSLPNPQAETFEWHDLFKTSTSHLVIGVLLGGLALWLSFRNVDGQVLWNTVAQMNYFWVLASVLCVLLTLMVVTVRWWWLLYPDHVRFGWDNLFAGVVVGQMVNIIFPLRLGEVVRAYFVGKREHLSKTRLMMTVIVEKIVDVGLFAVSVIVVLLSMSLPRWLSDSSYILAVTWGGAILAVLTLSLWGQAGLHLAEQWSAYLPTRWGEAIASRCHLAQDGLSAVHDRRANLIIWILSALSLLLSVVTNYFLFLAVGLQLPPVAALFVLVVLQVGNVPPSLPANLGVFHYLVILALSVFAIDPSIALGYAWLLYSVALLPKIIIGMAIVVRERWLLNR